MGIPGVGAKQRGGTYKLGIPGTGAAQRGGWLNNTVYPSNLQHPLIVFVIKLNILLSFLGLSALYLTKPEVNFLVSETLE